MKSAFDVKSTKVDALTVRMHDVDLNLVRKSLMVNAEKYKKFNRLPFILDLRYFPDPQTVPLAEIIQLFREHGLPVTGIRHTTRAWADSAHQQNLVFCPPEKQEQQANDYTITTVIPSVSNPTAEAEEKNHSQSQQSPNTVESKPVTDTVKQVQEVLSEIPVQSSTEPIIAELEKQKPSLSDPTEQTQELDDESYPPARPTLVVNAPVRAGQQVYAENADLIILGLVSYGAEVIADGNIHIYAPLRGRAIAGASGDKNARIFVQSMQAELVSIAGIYRVIEQKLPAHLNKKPVQIELQDNKLSISAIVAE